MDKAMGKAKEAYGAITGDEAKKAEGRAEQRKAEAEAEAKQREKTRQAEAEAKQAEKELDRQRRKDKGVLGDITDTGGLSNLTDKLTGR
jgi:uncharacterized protein YjbJ (UPF0337 family)